jgi:hypothetical protein
MTGEIISGVIVGWLRAQYTKPFGWVHLQDEPR